MELDLLDPKTHIDPWPKYTWLREEAPVYWDPFNEMWWISRYDDIVKVAKDTKRFTSENGNVPKLGKDPSFINMDGHPHVVRRNLVVERFGPRAIHKLEEHIREVVIDLIDDIQARGECDFVEAIAAPLPMRIIGEMCGIPQEYHDRVRRWTDVFGRGGNGPEHVTQEVNDAFQKFAMLHLEIVEQRKVEPRDDLLSIWIHADIEDENPYDDEETLLFEHTMMIFGGSETTRNAMAIGIHELASRPDQWNWLREHPEHLEDAVEEFMRWSTPFVRMSRTAVKNVKMHGKTIERDHEVAMLYPPANRDPRKFENADEFDVRRSFADTKSISFGYGAHFCLGARLARTEARIVLEEVLRRLPDLRPAGPPAWIESSFLRALSAMPVTFTPVGVRAAG